MLSPTIIIGAGNLAVLDTIDSDNVDLVVLPGETRPEARPGMRIHMPATIDQALMGFRHTYGYHSAITSLAGARILASHPVDDRFADTRSEWAGRIESYLGLLINDLGNCPIDTWHGARNAIHNAGTIAASPTSARLKGLHAGQPAICLAAGPSASKYISQISRLYHSHIVFACDVMLNACVDAGFVPHYTTAIERIPELHRAFAKNADCGTTLIAPPVLHPSSFACFKNKPVVWWGADDLYTWMSPTIEASASGRSAGTLSVAAALLAGCNPIYLVGHDLAYSDGRSHTAGFTRIFDVDPHFKADDWDPMHVKVETDRNGYGTVKTNGTWNLFRTDIESMIFAHPKQRVVNVNRNEGAVIAGAAYSHLPLDMGGLLYKPEIVGNGPTDIAARIPSIADDLTRLEYAARGHEDAIAYAETQADLDVIARAMTVGAIVSPENAWLFRYILRNIYHSGMLRLHLRQEEGMGAQREALRILTRTIPAMCALMRAEVPC